MLNVTPLFMVSSKHVGRRYNNKWDRRWSWSLYTSCLPSVLLPERRVTKERHTRRSVGLTCCRGHTSHSGGLRSPGTRCRCYTDCSSQQELCSPATQNQKLHISTQHNAPHVYWFTTQLISRCFSFSVSTTQTGSCILHCALPHGTVSLSAK